MSQSQVRGIEIVKYSGGKLENQPDLLVVEEPLEIRIGYGFAGERQQKNISITMRTPGHDFELAMGFLFSEGIITDVEQVTEIRYCEDGGRQEQKENIVRVELTEGVRVDLKQIERHFYTTSSCGVCGKTSLEAVRLNCPVITESWQLSEKSITTAPEKLRQVQQVFKHTGGLHASGFFDKTGELVLTREDVGRHNALDKLIGAFIAEKKIPLSNGFILVSGRVSFELVQKCAMAGAPIIAAIGSPSSLAVQLAEELGITLIGFVKEQSFNVYTVKERVISEN